MGLRLLYCSTSPLSSSQCVWDTEVCTEQSYPYTAKNGICTSLRRSGSIGQTSAFGVAGAGAGCCKGKQPRNARKQPPKPKLRSEPLTRLGADDPEPMRPEVVPVFGSTSGSSSMLQGKASGCTVGIPAHGVTGYKDCLTACRLNAQVVRIGFLLIHAQRHVR